jgi:hypothetical protein
MQTFYPELLPSLENTNYPFIPAASLSNNSVFFLQGTFLDAQIYAVGGVGNYYISSVVITSNHFKINIGDSNNSTLISGTVQLPIVESIIELTDSYGRPAGLLVSEPSRLALFSTWGIGTHTFEAKQTTFAITCQIPVPDAGVTGFVLPDGSLVTGNVWFVGEDGVVLRHEVGEDKYGNPTDLIRVDIVGDPLFLQRLCNPESLFVPVNPVRTVRIVADNQTFDCTPDEFGNITIQMNDSLAADAALRVRTTDVGLVFSVEGSATKE